MMNEYKFKYFYFLVQLSLILTTLSCTNEHTQKLHVDMIEECTIPNDICLLRDPIISYNDSILFYDQGEDYIVKKGNNNLSIISGFIKSGKGPGELEDPSKIVRYNSYLYISDNFAIKIFQDNKFVKQLNFNSLINDFIISNDTIFISQNSSNPVLMANMEGEIICEFGNRISPFNNMVDFYANSFYLNKFEDKLILSSFNTGIINIYNIKTRTLIKELQISTDYKIKGLYKINKNSEPQISTVINRPYLFQDINLLFIPSITQKPAVYCVEDSIAVKFVILNLQKMALIESTPQFILLNGAITFLDDNYFIIFDSFETRKLIKYRLKMMAL